MQADQRLPVARDRDRILSAIRAVARRFETGHDAAAALPRRHVQPLDILQGVRRLGFDSCVYQAGPGFLERYARGSVHVAGDGKRISEHEQNGSRRRRGHPSGGPLLRTVR